MQNSIIVSSCLFGSVYMCSTALQTINQAFLENKKIPNDLILINGLTFLISGAVFLHVVTSVRY